MEIINDFIVVVEENMQEENMNKEAEPKLSPKKLNAKINIVAQSLFSWIHLKMIIVSKDLIVVELEQTLLYLKFIDMLSTIRKLKDDIFFLSYHPP